jgi:hypothetical protein
MGTLVVRYVYIFCLKNPAVFNDCFWSFYWNIVIVIFSWISQLVIFVMSAGKEIHITHFSDTLRAVF